MRVCVYLYSYTVCISVRMCGVQRTSHHAAVKRPFTSLSSETAVETLPVALAHTHTQIQLSTYNYTGGCDIRYSGHEQEGGGSTDRNKETPPSLVSSVSCHHRCTSRFELDSVRRQYNIINIRYMARYIRI